jgi:hypothetical protein
MNMVHVTGDPAAKGETGSTMAGLFGFSDAELESNRGGVLTVEQRNRLIRRARIEEGLLALALVFPFALVMMLAIAVNPALSSLVSISALVLLFVVLSKSMRLRRDTASRQLAAATGAFHFTPTRFRGGLAHSASGLKLHYPPGLFSRQNPFSEGVHYTVYYVPGSNVIVSAEPLQSA